VRIDPVTDTDRAWVRDLVVAEWGGEFVVVHDEVLHPAELPGFIAREAGEAVGLLTYLVRGDACEIVTLNALRPGGGIGTGLMDAVAGAAAASGCRRLWLITTNDNLDALRFYQRRGFTFVAVHRNAVERSRRRKPQIPLVGDHGIPIRDEIELERRLGATD
jgi:ribosomal protein S18 acetylase RimI-like enzyme